LNPLPSANSRPSVLLVEDDANMRDLLMRTLEQAGYAVTTAVDGTDALAQFRKHPVDAVVTDILMPELDGFELIRKLKKESPGLAVVAISGINDYRHFRKLALASGANVALTKPIDRAQLVELLRTLAA
jgi:CheY-like chemotaxis protein